MNTRYTIFSVIFTMLLFLTGALIFALPARQYSVNENRYLKSKLDITVDSVFSGDAQGSINDYMNDQFLLRDSFTSACSGAKYAIGMRDIGGAYIGNKAYFEKVTENDFPHARYEKNLAFVNTFAKSSSVPVSVILVPSSGTVNATMLPRYAKMYDDNAVYSQAENKLADCTFYDLRNALSQGNDYYYFRTDHHWTARGAFVAYRIWADAHSASIAEPTFTTFANRFYGTLYSKVLLRHGISDYVEIADTATPTSVTKDGKNAAVYDLTANERKDKYEVFFGGNCGIIDIKCENNNGKTLLVIKDSYANCFVPYLIGDYERIIMIDLRFCSARVSEIITEYNVTDALVLFGLTSFAGESSIAKIGA